MRKLNFLFKRSLNDLYLNIRFLKKLAFKPDCIDFFFSDVHVFEMNRIVVNQQLGWPGEREGGWECSLAFLTTLRPLLCARGTCQPASYM